MLWVFSSCSVTKTGITLKVLVHITFEICSSHQMKVQIFLISSLQNFRQNRCCVQMSELLEFCICIQNDPFLQRWWEKYGLSPDKCKRCDYQTTNATTLFVVFVFSLLMSTTSRGDINTKCWNNEENLWYRFCTLCHQFKSSIRLWTICYPRYSISLPPDSDVARSFARG